MTGGWLWTQFVGGATRWQGAAGRGSVNMASPAKPGERGDFCGVEDAGDKEYYAIARCGLVGYEESGAENGVGGIITFVALARIA